VAPRQGFCRHRCSRRRELFLHRPGRCPVRESRYAVGSQSATGHHNPDQQSNEPAGGDPGTAQRSGALTDTPSGRTVVRCVGSGGPNARWGRGRSLGPRVPHHPRQQRTGDPGGCARDKGYHPPGRPTAPAAILGRGVLHRDHREAIQGSRCCYQQQRAKREVQPHTLAGRGTSAVHHTVVRWQALRSAVALGRGRSGAVGLDVGRAAGRTEDTLLWVRSGREAAAVRAGLCGAGGGPGGPDGGPGSARGGGWRWCGCVPRCCRA
jgi:hypothetical protein